MRRQFFLGCALVLFVLSLTTTVQAASPEVQGADLNALKEQIGLLQARVRELQQKIDAIRASALPAQETAAIPSVPTQARSISAPAQWLFTHRIEGEKLVGAEPRYTLISAPPGMQILSLYGLIYWVPTLDLVREQPYEIVVQISGEREVRVERFEVSVYSPPSGYYAVAPSGETSGIASAAEKAASPVKLTLEPPAPKAETKASPMPSFETTAVSGAAGEEEAGTLAQTYEAARGFTGLQWLGLVLLVGALGYIVYVWRQPSKRVST